MKKFILLKSIAIGSCVVFTALILVLAFFTPLPKWADFLIGIGLWLIVVLICEFLDRCPHCNKRFGLLYRWAPYNTCPYCGEDLDESL